jgi:Ca2+-binding EF-hand superfamily protein
MLSFCCDNTICRRENKHANKNSSIKRNEQNEITKVGIDVNECNIQRNQFSFVYSQSLNKTEEIAPSAALNPPFPQFHIDDKLLRAMKTSEEKWLSQKTERERKEYEKKLLRVIHLLKNRSLGKSYYAWTSYVYERKMIRKYANKIYIRRKLSVFLSWINFVERHKTLKLVNEVFSPEKTNNDDVFLLDFNSKHFPIPINRLKECIYNLYHRFDIDGNGYLVLNSLTDEEITDVFLTFDKDHDGKLDRSEFCTWILSGLSRSISKRIAYSKTSVLANKLNHFLNGIRTLVRIAQLRARLKKKKTF